MEKKKLGVVTASTGNHAQGFARALDIVNCQGTVYLPGTAAAVKVKALKKYDVQLEFTEIIVLKLKFKRKNKL